MEPNTCIDATQTRPLPPGGMAESFLHAPVRIYDSNSRQERHLVRMGYHVTPELRSLLQATGTELSETMKAAAARTRACELLAKLEVGLPLERHLTLLADSPMRGGTDQQVAMTGAEAGAETEMNQRVSNFRTRHAVTSPEGVPCHRGFVYEILQLIGMQNYIRILEQGLVGPFEEYHLASVQAFQKRHEELLLSPYQDTRKRHENDLLFALSYRHKPCEDTDALTLRRTESPSWTCGSSMICYRSFMPILPMVPVAPFSFGKTRWQREINPTTTLNGLTPGLSLTWFYQ